MWERRKRATPPPQMRPFDVQDGQALEDALALVRSECTSLTLNMCWHNGTGHDYPDGVMQAARRLRERHTVSSGVDDTYTSMRFTPSDDDLADFVLVAPYCDLAYATDAEGDEVLEVSGEGESGSVRNPQVAEPYRG